MHMIKVRVRYLISLTLLIVLLYMVFFSRCGNTYIWFYISVPALNYDLIITSYYAQDNDYFGNEDNNGDFETWVLVSSSILPERLR